ncbi:homoserine O-acetyltransferase family protein [Aquirufa antheringensis]|jgi:homoserine O-acetyltransferase|uniref:homoserine O-acetyltransferase family protein n=1 Tax=Aquirufa antheringensis TaxID=2516559 RepID=UPI0022A8BFCA|nr:homoserine O-acetyltransferase [Aquirufa antheringensis]MCZ2487677.1 homoserine O-acetyltransferase [Aquirufa antheringensis]
MQAEFHHFHSASPFALELGGELPALDLAYQTWGKLNAKKDNVVWICHAFTGSHDVAEWWQGLVGPGKLFNPENNLIVCLNILGSHYGSSGPLTVDPRTGKPYFHSFPDVTIRDVVSSFEILRKELKINRIKTCIGGSLGGQQAVEWAIVNPGLIENLILVATNAVHSPWGIAFNESQRMAIEVDPSWKESQPKAGLEGMKAARATALISYRNYETYQITQARKENTYGSSLRAVSYQRYQGEKLAQRFNAYSYFQLSKMMDSQDVGRNRGGAIAALKLIQSKTLVIGIKSDALFPIVEQEFLAKYIPGASFHVIDSLYGHDGFLIESGLMTKAVRLWQKLQRLEVNPMADFFQALEAKLTSHEISQ